MLAKNINFLEGKVLIATSLISDELYKKSVVYVCLHNEEKVMGVIVNKVIRNIDISTVLSRLNPEIGLKSKDLTIPLYYGGPNDQNRLFIIHGSQSHSDSTININSKFSVSMEIDIIRDMIIHNKPREYIAAIGCVVWNKQELEREIANNVWVPFDVNKSTMFHQSANDLWYNIPEKSGVDIKRLVSTTASKVIIH